MLQTERNKGLAATAELLLSSLMFQELRPDARDLLGVIAFLPQRVDGNDIDWLFPTIYGAGNVFERFCDLYLAHRNDDLIQRPP